MFPMKTDSSAMVDLTRGAFISQFEAALAMLNECLHKCPAEHWDSLIAKYPFWMVAYHTLCFVDCYLAPSNEAFEFRPDCTPPDGPSWTRNTPAGASRRRS
jgi:hypothetical protein